MGKTIKLTESELINIIQKTVLNNSVISEVIKVEDFDEVYPYYRYTNVGVRPSKNNPNEIGIVFFNGPEFNRSDYFEPEAPRTVYFLGPLDSEEDNFEFDSRMIRIRDGSPYVFGSDLKNVYYDKLLPLMISNNVQPSSSNFTSDDIKKSLKIAFPEYWKNETADFTAGLRGIETIGDYLKKQKDYDGDTSETWSLMNFFDTRVIAKLINQKWNKESKIWEGDKIDWLVNIFKNDNEVLTKLLSTQWKSVYSGFFKTEPSAIKKLKKMFEDEGLDATFKTYSFGHKNDRNSGVDVEFTIKGKKPRGVQIKPAGAIQYLDDGTIKVFTDSMKDSYKNKPKLDYILYDMGKKFHLFRNSDYEVVKNTNGSKVIHKKPEVRIYES